MMKRFWDGLIFGTGFSIAFTVISYLSMTFLVPLTLDYGSEQTLESFTSTDSGESVKFHELSFEDKLKNSSAILITRYEKGHGGKTIAIVDEVHLSSPNVKIYFQVGDEYPDGSFYPEENTRYGEGAFVMLVNSPADVRSSSSIYSGRISGYGNMPVETAITLFKESNK
jgi:hypothetical protein